MQIKENGNGLMTKSKQSSSKFLTFRNEMLKTNLKVSGSSSHRRAVFLSDNVMGLKFADH